jgi:O-antigen/teichoic acid export membrane protein
MRGSYGAPPGGGVVDQREAAGRPAVPFHRGRDGNRCWLGAFRGLLREGAFVPEAGARPATWTPRRLFHGVVATYLNVAVGALLGFLITPILLRELGEDRFGIWAMVLSIMSYIAFVEAGVGTAATTRAAAANAAGGVPAAVQVSGTVRALMLGIATVTVTISAAVAWLLPAHLADSGVPVDTLRVTIMLAAAWQALLFLTQVWNALYAGTGRLATVLRVGLVFNVVTNVAQVVGVLAGYGLIAMGAALAGGTLVQMTVLAVMARRHYAGLRITTRNADRQQARTLLRLGARNFGVTLAWTLSAGLDVLVVGLVVGPAGAAAYAVASRGAQLARVVTARFSDALVPAYGDAWHSGRRERLVRLYRLSLLFGFASAIPLALVLTFVAGPLLRVWLGADPPAGAVPVLVLMGTLVFLQLPGQCAVTLVTAIEQTHAALRLLLVAGLVNAVLSVALTFWLGVTGPVVSTLLVTLAVDPVLYLLVLRRRLQIDVRAVLLPVARYLAPCSVVAVGLAVGILAAPLSDLGQVLAAVSIPMGFGIVLLLQPGTTELPRVRELLATVRARS